MQRKLYTPDKVMTLKILDIIEVVHVKYGDFILLAYFKVILYIELLDPLWREAVHNNFGPA